MKGIKKPAALCALVPLLAAVTLGGGGKVGTAQAATATTAHYAAVAPAIDGQVDAVWDNVTAYYLNDHYEVNKPYEVPLATGYFKVLWDEDNLYLLAVIADRRVTDYDHVSFWVSENDTKYYNWQASDGDYVLNVNPSGIAALYIPDPESGFAKGNPDILTAAQTAGEVTVEGYTVEVRVPFFTPFSREEGHVTAINVSVNEYYPDNPERVDYCSWYGEKTYTASGGGKDVYYWDGSAGCPSLVFVTAPAPAPETPETQDPPAKQPQGCAGVSVASALLGVLALFAIRFKKQS
jgi:hypothetical protein